MKSIMNFIRNEEGLELSEYALILGLIVVAIITILGLIGTNISNIFSAFQTTLSTVPGA